MRGLGMIGSFFFLKGIFGRTGISIFGRHDVALNVCV